MKASCLCIDCHAVQVLMVVMMQARDDHCFDSSGTPSRGAGVPEKGCPDDNRPPARSRGRLSRLITLFLLRKPQLYFIA